ncbi:MAG TPA: hypothetical protein VI792_03325 [Candidatus Eisenbacteria bacterium]
MKRKCVAVDASGGIVAMADSYQELVSAVGDHDDYTMIRFPRTALPTPPTAEEIARYEAHKADALRHVHQPPPPADTGSLAPPQIADLQATAAAQQAAAPEAAILPPALLPEPEIATPRPTPAAMKTAPPGWVWEKFANGERLVRVVDAEPPIRDQVLAAGVSSPPPVVEETPEQREIRELQERIAKLTGKRS